MTLEQKQYQKTIIVPQACSTLRRRLFGLLVLAYQDFWHGIDLLYFDLNTFSHCGGLESPDSSYD